MRKEPLHKTEHFVLLISLNKMDYSKVKSSRTSKKNVDQGSVTSELNYASFLSLSIRIVDKSYRRIFGPQYKVYHKNTNPYG